MLEIGERVSVIAAFEKHVRLRPLRFMWSGRQVDIKEITYEWTTSEGKNKLLHFSVTDGSTLYELSFDTHSILWRLEGVETEV
jgi:hypothetical protein